MCARITPRTLILLAALTISQLHYCQAEEKISPAVIPIRIKGRSEHLEKQKALLLEARLSAKINLRSARQQLHELRFARRIALR